MNSVTEDLSEALFLGTGTSTGVPQIGCSCPVCTSPDSRNNRLRSSLYVRQDNFCLLIDTSPDFRQQALRYKLPRIDAVLITHGHVDHTFGLDDIRRYNTLQQEKIPVYASSFTLAMLGRVFDYFKNPPVQGAYLPQVDFQEINPAGIQLGPFRISPFAVEHGYEPTYGYRIDTKKSSLAYAPDCSNFPSAAYKAVQGVKVMILDALRHRPHGSHMTVAQSLEVLQRIGAPRSYLTHLSHDLDHETLQKTLPQGITPAYDGLKIAW